MIKIDRKIKRPVKRVLKKLVFMITTKRASGEMLKIKFSAFQDTKDTERMKVKMRGN